jgi:cytochrome P450
MDWIQYETTRLFGPSGFIFFRESRQDQLLKDVPITKDTVLTYTNLSIHQNPEVYPDPKRFWPERW